MNRRYAPRHMNYQETTVQSKIDNRYMCKMYTNGYFFYRNDDPNQSAIELRNVPQEIRDEMGPDAYKLMGYKYPEGTPL